MTSGHVFLATSLDGFVARPDHRLDWLTKQHTETEDHGYDDFMSRADGLVMGRGSFHNALSFGDWPYRKPVVLMSRSMTPSDIPEALRGKVRLMADSPAGVMRSLDDEGWKRAYIDGGALVQSFIADGLISEITMTVIPILIGRGVRPFGDIEHDIDLRLCESRTFPSGLVQSRYRIVAPS